jgi:hypothetical protein
MRKILLKYWETKTGSPPPPTRYDDGSLTFPAPLEPVGTRWNPLGPVGTRCNPLGPVVTGWDPCWKPSSFGGVY